ncbi:histone-lysine N-methyltransferase SETMAR-like [Onthophagus taurus]|uniref:histone-lysine N-methyltransferase SETMAR-like n=1 Tax=Onthophagus taurus TaxID=166361 RepID=UPI0039BE6D77
MLFSFVLVILRYILIEIVICCYFLPCSVFISPVLFNICYCFVFIFEHLLLRIYFKIIMAHLSETQRIEILILIGCGDETRTQQEVYNLFNAKYPDRVISRSTVSKIDKKFRETGHVTHIAHAGRPKINENVKLNILLAVEDDPHSNSRQIAADHQVSQRSVLRVLRAERYHPYKVQLVQELNEDDTDRRMEFCEIMQNRCDRNPLFIYNVLFSDEATFCLNGTVKRQNCRYWSNENPHWISEVHTQYPQKVNVWAGIIHNKIIGPFFFEQILTGQRYLEFLRNELMPVLLEAFPNNNNPNLLDDNIWFQQDGALPHVAHPVREFLNNSFPERWIGRRGPIEWPPRSPDLIPLDFFLWGYLKSKVYAEKPLNVDALKNCISAEIRNISPQFIYNTLKECMNRFAYCQEVGGGHFEQLIK